MNDLREGVRQGTLRRMREALAGVDDRLEDLRAERAGLAASIAEVEGRPPGLAPSTDDREPLLPVTSPRVENALIRIMRDVGSSEAQIVTRFPDRGVPGAPEPAVLAVATFDAAGRLVVSAPGTPSHGIVALRPKRAGAAAQRVAELVEEAIVARDRQVGPWISETDLERVMN